MTEDQLQIAIADYITWGSKKISEYTLQHKNKKRKYFIMECACGKEYKRENYRIHPKSLCRSCYISNRNKSHNLSKTKEYAIWNYMIQRCKNPKRESYKYYGGRGIKVCERWLKFENFYADMGPRPSSKHSIDRINNNGNYEPANCKWSTSCEQTRNYSRNRYYEFNGTNYSLIDLVKFSKVNYAILRYRLNKGWPLSKALSFPKQMRVKNHA